MNTPTLIVSKLSLGNFSHKTENAGPFLSGTFAKFFMRPNLICRVGSNTLHWSTRNWLATFFVPGYVMYEKASSSCCNEHFWHAYPIRIRNNRILYNTFAVTSRWQLHSNHCKCASDTACISCSWECPFCFHMLPFCGQERQKGLKAINFPCSTAMLLG